VSRLACADGATRLRRYPSYKPSGVEWLGEVPEHWEVKRLKHLARLLTEKAQQRERPLALENIESWTGRFVPTESDFEGDGTLFEPGDILFGKLRPYLAKIYVAEFRGEAIGDFHVLRPTSAIITRFLQRSMLTREFIDVIDGSTFGAKMPRASWEALGGMQVAVPPIDEQRAIADFLDRETGKLDALVAEQRKLIELLKEKRQAVISHAVTRGLDPTAPTRPSGVEWLGDIPAHWQMLPVWLLFHIGRGRVISHEEIYKNPGIYPVYSSQTENDGAMGHLSTYDFDGQYITWTTDGANAGTVFSRKGRFNCTNVCGTLQVKSPLVDIEFAKYALSIMTGYHVRHDINPKLRNNVMARVRLPLPDTQVQSQIVAYLDEQTARIDTLLAQAQRAIELLAERRTALISAATTGAIDVRP
jgi:type I restriction enzyme, S subunit